MSIWQHGCFQGLKKCRIPHLSNLPQHHQHNNNNKLLHPNQIGYSLKPLEAWMVLLQDVIDLDLDLLRKENDVHDNEHLNDHHRLLLHHSLFYHDWDVPMIERYLSTHQMVSVDWHDYVMDRRYLYMYSSTFSFWSIGFSQAFFHSKCQSLQVLACLQSRRAMSLLSSQDHLPVCILLFSCFKCTHISALVIFQTVQRMHPNACSFILKSAHHNNHVHLQSWHHQPKSLFLVDSSHTAQILFAHSFIQIHHPCQL